MGLREAIQEKYVNKYNNREDSFVLSFLLKIQSGAYLEAGCGLGRFVDVIDKRFNFDVTCLDINEDFCQQIRKRGFNVNNSSVLDTGFTSNSFDVIHCSHVIEHFGYPEVTGALDELARILKVGGYLIIRSPLMWHRFYNDMDHIRPYPPQSVINYFNALQQQKKSKYIVKKIDLWYRRTALEIIDGNRFFDDFNLLLKLLWIYFGFPFSKRNGYVLILKKEA